MKKKIVTHELSKTKETNKQNPNKQSKGTQIYITYIYLYKYI